MDAFDMKGNWGYFTTFVYERLVASGIEQLYGRIPPELLAESDFRSVLDVGCGGGQMVAIIASSLPNAKVAGVDLSPVMIKMAQKLIRKKELKNAQVRVASAMELPFEEGSFDLVVSTGSIKHWPDQAKGLSEIWRVLRPKGKAFVLEADRSCTFESAENFVKMWRIPKGKAFLKQFLMYFRTFVAGQSLDLDDARRLLSSSPFTNFVVERYEGFPFLTIRAEKVEKVSGRSKSKGKNKPD